MGSQQREVFFHICTHAVVMDCSDEHYDVAGGYEVIACDSCNQCNPEHDNFAGPRLDEVLPFTPRVRGYKRLEALERVARNMGKNWFAGRIYEMGLLAEHHDDPIQRPIWNDVRKIAVIVGAKLIALGVWEADAIPRITSDDNEEGHECSICLEGFVPNYYTHRHDAQFIADLIGIARNPVVPLALPCPGRHAFHYRCINPWLDNELKCPYCRVGLQREGFQRAFGGFLIAGDGADWFMRETWW